MVITSLSPFQSVSNPTVLGLSPLICFGIFGRSLFHSSPLASTVTRRLEKKMKTGKPRTEPRPSTKHDTTPARSNGSRERVSPIRIQIKGSCDERPILREKQLKEPAPGLQECGHISRPQTTPSPTLEDTNPQTVLFQPDRRQNKP